jgi:transcriptional regulator with XRE-family HTH domain
VKRLKSVGLKIKEYMEKKGINQSEIADMVGIPRPKLNKMLNGEQKISLDDYELICGALGVGVEEFLTPKRIVLL